MRQKPFIALLILLLLNLFLVTFSYYYSHTSYELIQKNIRFVKFEDLFQFETTHENNAADSLLQGFLSGSGQMSGVFNRTPLHEVGPKKQNIYLTNPEINGGKVLDEFFKILNEEKDKEVVRIAHYGDSQLEGDRMTSVIRQKIHKKFGGSGIGYVPLLDLPTISYTRNSSGNWKKYTVFHDRYFSSFYGLSGTVCLFTHAHVADEQETGKENDTIVNHHKDTSKTKKTLYYQNASVSVSMNSSLAFNRVSVLYGNSREDCFLKMYDNKSGNLLKSDTLRASEKVCYHPMPVSGVLQLKLEFSANESPEFYGLYFDSDKGVQVDNYAIRGHSGDGLLMINDQHLSDMLKLTNTKLIIFQYGANIVPYIDSDAECKAIGEVYYKLFMKFKAAAPGVSILVVGAGDMAHGVAGGYTSYKWLPRINEMQKETALRAGCAYWDLFSMMGGSNSILVWTKKNMAVTNGHFSGKGQEVVAKEIVDALFIEYNDYLFRQKNKK